MIPKKKLSNPHLFDVVYEQKFAGKHYDNRTISIKSYGIKNPLKEINLLKLLVDQAYSQTIKIEIIEKNLMQLNLEKTRSKNPIELKQIETKIKAMQEDLNRLLNESKINIKTK